MVCVFVSCFRLPRSASCALGAREVEWVREVRERARVVANGREGVPDRGHRRGEQGPVLGRRLRKAGCRSASTKRGDCRWLVGLGEQVPSLPGRLTTTDSHSQNENGEGQLPQWQQTQASEAQAESQRIPSLINAGRFWWCCCWRVRRGKKLNACQALPNAGHRSRSALGLAFAGPEKGETERATMATVDASGSQRAEPSKTGFATGTGGQTEAAIRQPLADQRS